MSTEVVTADISCMFYSSFYLFFYLLSDCILPSLLPSLTPLAPPPKQRLSAQVLSALANQNRAFRPPPQASTKLGSYHVSGH